MNLGKLAGIVIFVLVFGILSHSLTNSAFAINTSHEKSMKKGMFYYSTNMKVLKDQYIEKKTKEAKEAAAAKINQLKKMAKSKSKGYSE